DVVVVLVGSGPEEPELRRLADRLGLGGRVRFVGESTHEESRGQGADVPDLPSLLSAMDALASPSPEEAFGLALVEGLASGLPVLYASCPAVEGLD
ncbi:glycosyltransferase, partial [Streptomyces sp. SID10116]|nr:glycosyltransferase [Streptomyces sp. SID10116]